MGRLSGGDSTGRMIRAVRRPLRAQRVLTEVSEGRCELPATISSDMTLTSGVDYLMTAGVTVGNGNGQLETNGDGTLDDGSAVQAATLTIEAGGSVW